MSETARLIGMLQASKAQLSGHSTSDSSAHSGVTPDTRLPQRSTSEYNATSTTSTSIPCSLADALEFAIAGGPLPPKPTEPQLQRQRRIEPHFSRPKQVRFFRI
jgi:hypothetical protein